ncbi:DUF4132 domain-containing protein [Streptomyces sp. NPDC000410]|uniref:DUF4132 domain-containing protein n=1 Tax=Streptomyces sp. NPDC000410 TaxID=3154254 RepID=UPI003330C02C
MNDHVEVLLDPDNSWIERVRDRLTGLSPELEELVLHLATTAEFWNYRYQVDTTWKRRTKALLKTDGAGELVRDAIRALSEGGSLHGMTDAEHVIRELGMVKPPSPARALAIGFTLAAGWLGGDVDRLAADLVVVARKNAQAMDTYYRPDDDLAGAVFTALGELRGPAALEALWTLHFHVTNSQHPHKVLVKSVKKAAARLGVPAYELAERTVSRCGLEPDGTLPVGWIGHGVLWWNAGLDAVITLHDDGRVTVDWTDEQGTTTRTISPFRSPAGYKARHRVEDVDGVRRGARAVEKTVAEERRRLSGLAAENRTWSHADWVRYYRDHPVTRVVTRSLDWEYEIPDGLGHRPLDPGAAPAAVPATARVRLRPPADA